MFLVGTGGLWRRVSTFSLVILASGVVGLLSAEEATGPISLITGNPAATEVNPGTGQLGEWIAEKIGMPEETGLRLGGVGVADFNWLMAGGESPGRTSWNFLFIVGLNADLEKLIHLPGSEIAVDALFFRGQPTNDYAASAQGYNGLPGAPPLQRGELYQFYWKQRWFEDRLVWRLGKQLPSVTFNNVLQGLPVREGALMLPAVSGLIYTPVFTNPTMLGVLPGYYNSAYGFSVTALPFSHLYLSGGIYDGALAQGFNTGNLAWPVFNGSWFMIGEIGVDWQLTTDGYLGRAAFGGWNQTGTLSTGSGVSEDGTYGFYGFASQTVWEGRRAGDATSQQGLVTFLQLGINDSETLPINGYVGGGATVFGVVPGRTADSFGAGFALSWLNRNVFERDHELMWQVYYQAQLTENFIFQPTLTYIHQPGQDPHASNAWALGARLTFLF